MRIARLIVLAVILILSWSESARAALVLRRGNGAEPQTLNPQLSESMTDNNIERDLFEGLVTLDPAGQPKPAAASSWTISADGLVYTFHLRPNLRWSDGTTLTAEDFVWSWRHAVDPALGSKYTFLSDPIHNAHDIAAGKITDLTQLGVRAVDPLTFEVKLDSRTDYFISLIAHGRFFPVQRANVERDGSSFTRPGKLVSNGAFMLQEWTPQSRIIVVKNPFYWAAADVQLDEIDYLPIENENEELKRYRAGELDITSTVPADQIGFIRANLPAEFHVWPLLGAYYLGLNLTRLPFKDNPKLREALALVIDREAITDKILKTGEIPAYSWVPAGLPGYTPQTLAFQSWPMAARIERAKQLYAEAGYSADHPLKLELRYNTSENHKRIMIAIAAMLKQALGVETTLINEEFKVLLEDRKEKRVTQMFRASWTADYADAHSFAELLCGQAGLNDLGYANADYDQLVEASTKAADTPTRLRLLEQAEKQALADMPLIPIYDYVSKAMVKPGISGYAPNLLGYSYGRDIRITPE